MALLLTRADVEKVLTMREAITAVENGFLQLALGAVAMPQRTVVPRPRPPPRTDPVATCVVERAKPRWLEVRSTAAVAPSLDIPWRGVMSTSPLPRVRMIRQPPM